MIEATDVRESGALLGIVTCLVFLWRGWTAAQELYLSRFWLGPKEREAQCRVLNFSIGIFLIAASATYFNLDYGFVRTPDFQSTLGGQIAQYVRSLGFLVTIRMATYQRFGEWFWLATFVVCFGTAYVYPQ